MAAVEKVTLPGLLAVEKVAWSWREGEALVRAALRTATDVFFLILKKVVDGGYHYSPHTTASTGL
jgi:hypothetical protein